MDLINQFIENYKKKLTFYENLGRISSSQLEDALQSAGIRAMVTYRIKNPGRLKSKILRRNVKRTVPYKNMKEIYEDIADLCGIRVSLYFPGDRIKVDSLISDLFQVTSANSSRNSPNRLPITNVFPATGPIITGCI